MDAFQAHEQAEATRRQAAMVDGRRYTTFVDEVKALRRSGDLNTAAGVLLRLVDAVEREAAIPLAGHAAPPCYHTQLAEIEAMGIVQFARLVRSNNTSGMPGGVWQARLPECGFSANEREPGADDEAEWLPVAPW